MLWPSSIPSRSAKFLLVSLLLAKFGVNCEPHVRHHRHYDGNSHRQAATRTPGSLLDTTHRRSRALSDLLGANLPPPCPASQPGGFGVVDEPDRDVSAFGANAALFGALKYSVVRIQTDSRSSRGTEQEIGSGWMVNATATMSDPFDYTIITNAHVVSNAGRVRVQLPSLGRMTFEATVPMICFDFDLAVVKITNTSDLRARLEEENIRVKLLNLRSKNIKMGMKVAALGFSLGSQWLKLSEGVISGAEAVGQNMVYQSTAPISPGNSGGPLLLFQKRNGVQTLDSVIGVNFASSSSKEAQNLNYAVPAFRVLQVLMAYQKQRNSSCRSLDNLGSGTQAHMQLRIPPVGLIYTQSTKAQLQKSKCEKGIQLAKFSKYSLFRYATPPIQERHILTHVDTTSLDNFGMGKRLEFVHADVSLVDLLTFRTSLSDPVQVTTCSDGAFTNHTLSLEWNTSRYEPGIRFVYEPEFDAGYGEYESFAGLTITQLTQNDIEGWVKAKSGQSLARFQLEEYMEQPRVAISSCESGATCDYVLNAGMIIDKLNGCNISTLADVRRCFVPFGRTLWELVTDRGYIFQADFDKEMAKEVEKSNKDPSVMSQAVARASGLLTTTTTTSDAAAEMEVNFPISEVRPDLSMTPPLEVKFGGHALRGDTILSSGVLKKKRKRWKRMHSKYVDEHGDAAPLMAEQSEAWLPGMAEESEAWLPGMG